MAFDAVEAAILIGEIRDMRTRLIGARDRLSESELDLAVSAKTAINLLTDLLHSLKHRGGRERVGRVTLRRHEVTALSSVVLVSRAVENFAERAEPAPEAEAVH